LSRNSNHNRSEAEIAGLETSHPSGKWTRMDTDDELDFEKESSIG